MIKVGFLLSYDYEFIKIALPCVYDHADLIVFSLDKNRMSWSGNPFIFNESILAWIKDYDKQNKIKIYEDNFYVKERKAIENETRQRNMMAAFMGFGGWHIQLDSDEYFVNFKNFVDYLGSLRHYLTNPEKDKVSIRVNLFNLLKQDKDGFFYVKKGKYMSACVATNYPQYIIARNTDQFQIFTPFIMVHQSWARDSEEIDYKINNWGHKDDPGNKTFYEIWKSINKDNYYSFKNFAPGSMPSMWNSIGLTPHKTAVELIAGFDQIDFTVSPFKLLLKNAIQLLRHKLRLKGK